MVMIDFTGVKEASDSIKTIKEGFLSTLITKAEEMPNDKNELCFKFEFTVQSGQYKDEKISTVINTVTATNRLSRMYSRILDIKLTGQRDCKALEFMGQYCMIEMKQKRGSDYIDKKTGESKTSKTFYSNVDYAGFFNISDYSPAMDEKMSDCPAFIALQEANESGTATVAQTSSSVAGF